MKRTILCAILLIMALALLMGCTTPEPEVIKETVEVEKVVTQVIKETVVVEGTPQVVEKEVIVEKDVTVEPEPVNKQGGTFTWGVVSEPPGFNPILNDDWTELWTFGFTHEPLTWGGENYPSELRPILAESWETSEDGLTWTIHLRDGVKWQDGTPFTADDVLFWAQAVQDDATGAVYFQENFYAGGEPYQFTKIDDLTVEITTKEPVPNLLNRICLPLIPEHIFADNNVGNADMMTDKSNTEGMTGTGPFMVDEYQRGEAVILKRFDDYWGGAPYLDQVIFRIVPDHESLAIALETGEVDWGRIDRPELIPKLLESGNVDINPVLVDSVYNVYINNQKPMLSDKRTRQAMMYALDRQGILNARNLGYGQVVDSPWNTVVDIYEPMENQYTYDTEKAQALLAEVGWVAGADGVLVAENVEGVEPGTRFSLEYWATGSDKIAPLIQSYFKDVGIEVTLRMVDSATIRTENSGLADKPFDLYTGSWGWLGTDPGAYSWNYGSSDIASCPFSYSNPEVTGLFDQAKQETDKATRDQLYQQAGELIWDDAPVLWLYYRQIIWASGKNVHIEEAVPNSAKYSVFEYPEKIWIEQ